MARRTGPTTSKGLTRSTQSKTLKIRPFHAHGCEVCSARYTDACDTPLVNGRCSLHRERHPRPRVVWDTDVDPVECCRTNAIPANDHTRELYALGGPGPWWICRTCARTSPYDPTTGEGTGR